MLDFYCRRFQTVEINNSFYHLPSVGTFRGWKEQTPAGFTFAVKANRYITHMKKLKDPAASIARFFAAVEALDELSEHGGATTTMWRDIAIVAGTAVLALVAASTTLRRRSG